MKTLIIAEAGVNHNGSRELAIKLIDVAHAAGADYVKFQSFKANKLVSKDAKKAEYQKKTTGALETQYEMIRKLELSEADHDFLHDYCRKVGIGFLSTPFDEESLEMLVRRFGMDVIKISSGDLTNSPFLIRVASYGVKTILSTGMATMEEVESALAALAWGYLRSSTSPASLSELKSILIDPEGIRILSERVTILHCTTEYPAPLNEVNLRAMLTMRERFGLRVGYSDHTQGITIPIAAVSLGAELIEKHYTLDRSMEGPDHKASLEPSELKAMIDSIRAVELSLGDGLKRPMPSEMRNRDVARRSIVARKNIPVGKVIEFDDVEFKRPGDGLSPERVWDLIGNRSRKNYLTGELLLSTEVN